MTVVASSRPHEGILPHHAKLQPSGLAVSLQPGSAPFQRRLSIPQGDGQSVQTSFPGVLVPESSDSSTGPADLLPQFLQTASLLAAQPQQDAGQMDSRTDRVSCHVSLH
jgi:hypothetical protein